MALTLPAKVKLEGEGTALLDQSAHLSTGGEGSVFRIGAHAVKIYLNQKRMRKEGLSDKLELLKAITHPYVVAPLGLVYGSSGEPIGYYMRYRTGEALPRLFTNDFRTRVGFTDTDTHTLVEHAIKAGNA